MGTARSSRATRGRIRFAGLGRSLPTLYRGLAPARPRFCISNDQCSRRKRGGNPLVVTALVASVTRLLPIPPIVA